MELKTFDGRTMADALAKVKSQFGSDAVILHTRTRRKSGVLGYRGREWVEITAAAGGYSSPPRNASKPAQSDTKTERFERESVRSRPRPDGTTWAAGSSLSPEPLSARATPNVRISSHTTSGRGTTETSPVAVSQIYEQLIAAEVSEEIASALVRRVLNELSPNELANSQTVRRRLAAFVESMLPVAGAVRLVKAPGPAVIAFVGPTGVGKTTTVAKLAANCHVRYRKRVGLVTVDTRRIGAVEQIQTYADIIGISLKVVTSRREIRRALDDLKHCDIVFIDTAGCNPLDSRSLSKLHRLLGEARPNEVHLVLASTASVKSLRRTIDRFHALKFNRVVMTKLDEAVGFGVILSCLHDAHTRLSYITTGQKVPGDIEVGSASRVSRLIMAIDEHQTSPASTAEMQRGMA